MKTLAGLEKSAAIRPFATKKSRLASEKILLADSLATESCSLADRLATKLFFKADNADADRTWSRKVRGRRLCCSKMQRSWPFGPRRSCLRVNPLPVSRCLPWDSPSETIWALWGGENIVRAVTVSLRGTLVSTWVLFSSGFEPSKRPSASTDTSVRSKKKKKQKNSTKKVRRRTERRRQQQRGGKFQRASILFFTYTRIPLWLRWAEQTITTSKYNRSAFLFICRFGDWNFSCTATLATKTFRLLPPWRVLPKRFFEPWLEAKPFDRNAENWKRENRLFTSTVLEAGASGKNRIGTHALRSHRTVWFFFAAQTLDSC